MIEAWLLAASVWVIPVLLAITLHEAAHGWVALRLGDDTAQRLGRVTLNPIKHVHPVGTILLPGALIALGAPFVFGFAKPVPVNPARLRRPRRDMVLVALAGPGMNVLLACLSALMLHVAPVFPAVMAEWWRITFTLGIVINLVLAIFNMLPVPPLDGGRVVHGLLPQGPPRVSRDSNALVSSRCWSHSFSCRWSRRSSAARSARWPRSCCRRRQRATS